jgi:hypothetical protein
MQEDWEEDRCRYKCCAEHSEKAGIQGKDIKEDRELLGNA